MRMFFGWVGIFLFIATAALSAQTASTSTESASTSTPTSAPVPSSGPDAAHAEADPVPAEKLALDPHFKVTKVHIVNNTENYKSGGNPALEFELDYWNYGAVTKAQKEARRGQIYLISWHKDGAPENLTARFEYRLVKARDQVFVKNQDLAGVSGTNRSLFEVVGDEYRTNGAVYAWRFLILRGDQIVALERSYVW